MKRSAVSATYRLIVGKCEEAMRGLDPVDLIIADPPYNYGHPYDAYADNLTFDDYMEWTCSWLKVAKEVMAAHGALFIFMPTDLVSFVDVMCQKDFKLYKRAQICWAYSFGVCNHAMKNFSRSNAHILYYVRNKSKFVFNGPSIAVPSSRSLVYKDKRANLAGKVPDSYWLLTKAEMEKVLTPDMDTWLESRVCGTYKAKQKDSPNQLPVSLLERIVLAGSNPGDTVLCPFNGSGSEGVASLKNGRNYIGIDVSKNYLNNTRRRFAEDVPSAVEA